MMLAGKAVLVTGTASGIGRETAIVCAQQGARAIACLDIHEENNEKTAAELRAMGVESVACHVDLGDVGQIRDAYAKALGVLKRLDGAAHIGGYSWRGETLDITVEQWDTVINANLRSTFFCCQEALRLMYAQGSGSIVNTSADAAFYPIEGMAVQAAGKGGIVNMTRTLALEAARRGVRVNVVSPGIVRTQQSGMQRPQQPPLRRDAPPTPREAMDVLANQTAPGRYLKMEEMAQTYAFLLSDLSSGISGDLVSVNGGGYFALQY